MKSVWELRNKNVHERYDTINKLICNQLELYLLNHLSFPCDQNEVRHKTLFYPEGFFPNRTPKRFDEETYIAIPDRVPIVTTLTPKKKRFISCRLLIVFKGKSLQNHY